MQKIKCLDSYRQVLKSQSHRTLYIPLPGDTDNNKVEFKMEPIENGIQEGSFERVS
jgi:hypothetical protein